MHEYGYGGSQKDELMYMYNKQEDIWEKARDDLYTDGVREENDPD